MTRPDVHAAAEQAYRLLPDYVRVVDPSTDYATLRFTAASVAGLERALDTLTLADPGTSVSGTCELVNAAAAPRRFLPWLGWLVGVNTSGIADAYVRDAIANAAATQRRGSIGSIRDAVQRTLTGGRNCRMYWNVSGVDPYLITVLTLTAETPDTAAALAAAWTEKPAGMDLELQTAAGATWADVVAAYPTWNAVVAAHPTWNDLTTWLP